ncbi:MAG: class I SAM-dependent methyltransferase [Actinomycetota bacterium]
MSLTPELRRTALAAKGFMPEDEGDALHAAALEAGSTLPGRPFLEVGSYCGRSTIWLGEAARQRDTVLFAVDHHRGSEENQEGWEWHDSSLVDPANGMMDTLPTFRRTVFEAGLEPWVVAVVGESPVVARHWGTPLAFLFIDGGHGVEVARRDYQGWSDRVEVGGTLAIHDVFTDPDDGGQAPYREIYLPAVSSGRYREIGAVGSLRILRRS